MIERKYVIAAITAAIVIFGVFVWAVAEAEPEVKYCKNLTTGEVFVVEANYPCPGNTVKI